MLRFGCLFLVACQPRPGVVTPSPDAPAVGGPDVAVVEPPGTPVADLFPEVTEDLPDPTGIAVVEAPPWGVPAALAVDPAGDVWVAGDDGLGVWSAGEWRWVAALPNGEPGAYDLAVLADGVVLLGFDDTLYTFDGTDWTVLVTLNPGIAVFEFARDAVHVREHYGSDVARVRSDGSLEILDTDAYNTGPVWRDGDRLYAKFYETLMEMPATGDVSDGSQWQPSSFDPGFYVYLAGGIGDAVWVFDLLGSVASVRDGRIVPEGSVGVGPSMWAERDEVFSCADGVLAWQHGGTGWTTLGELAPVSLRGNGRGDVYGLASSGELVRVVR